MAVVLDQNHFRWRHDDGTETTATWVAAVDTAPSTIYPDTVYRIRLSIQETGGTKFDKSTLSLYASKNGSSYSLLPTAPGATVRGVIGGLVQDENTTQQISTGTFTTKNGGCADGSATVSASIEANRVAEFEWSIAFPYDSVSDGDVFSFRAYASGAPIATYTVTPSITITKPVYRRFEVTDYRWRRDDGSEITATWAAPTDSEIYSLVDSVKRLRLVVKEKYGQVGVYPNWQDFEVTLEVGSLTHAWAQVTQTSAHTQIANSANLTAGSDTTQQIGVGSFVGYNGQFDGVDSITPALWATNESIPAGYEWEVEVPINFSGLDVSLGEHFDFRLASTLGAGVAKPFDAAQTVRVNIDPWPMSGAIAAQSSVTGAVTLRQAMVGAITAQSSVNGVLTARKVLSGAITAQSSVDGTISARRKLVGSISSASSVNGAITARRRLAGSVTAQSSLSGVATLRMALSGALQAAASLTGTLAVTAAMSGSIEAASTISGNLTAQNRLAGHIAAASSVSGDITGLRLALQGHIEGQTELTGLLRHFQTYYVRADGTASTKEQATSPNGQSTSMSPAVWASETFEPGDTVVWSAKGGDYEQVSVANSSSGLAQYPITIRGEFPGASRPWISGGIKVTGAWTQVPDKDRWWIPLTASPKSRNLVADGVDLGLEAGTPSEVNQPGQWYHNTFDNRLYMGGPSNPGFAYSSIWVQRTEGPILTIGGSNVIIEDLYLTMGYRSGYPPDTAGLQVSGDNVAINGVGGIGHYGTGIGAAGIYGLAVYDANFLSSWHGIDVSDSVNPNGTLINRSSFLNCQGTAVKVENSGFVGGQIFRKVHTGAFERNFTLANMYDGLIESCRMQISGEGPDAFIGGVNVVGGVSSTIVRNCRIDGGGYMLAGLVIFDPTGSVQISFVHNQLHHTNYGAVFVAEYNYWPIEVRVFNNTAITTVGGFYYFSAPDISAYVFNNVFFNAYGFLDNPIGGWIDFGTAESGGTLQFAWNHYRDPRKPLVFAYKGDVVPFGTWCSYVGEYASAEQNPVLKNPSAGQYWPASSGSPIVGSGGRLDTTGPLRFGIAPDSQWPDVNIVDQEKFLSPGWTRGAYVGTEGELDLEGSIGAQSTLVGDLKIVPESLEGHIAASSALVGNLKQYDSGSIPLAGHVAAKSTVFGDLTGPMRWRLEGHIAAQSVLEADLYTPTHWSLEGAIAEQTNLYGRLEQIHLWVLAGAVEAQSDLSGAMTQKMALEGSVEAQSSLSGSLAVTHRLEGSITAQSTVSGNLTQIDVVWPLEGHVAAASSLSGDLKTARRLEGSIDAQSSLSGALSLHQRLQGSIDAQSLIIGNGHRIRTADQSLVDSSNSPFGGPNTYTIAASYRPYDDCKLWHVHVKWQRVGTLFGNVWLELAGEDPFNPNQPELNNPIANSNLIAANTIGTSGTGTVLKFSFEDRPQLIEGNLYYLVARFSWPENFSNYLRWRRAPFTYPSQNIFPITSIDEYQGLLVYSSGPQEYNDLYTVMRVEFNQPPTFPLVNYPIGVASLLSGDLGVSQVLSAVDDATHGHTADSLDLLQHHVLSIDDSAHGHQADPLSLTQNIDLSIDDAAHGHTADEATPAITHHLAIQDAFHVQFAEEISLTEVYTLSIEDALHGHEAGTIDLDQAHVLAVDDAAHYHIADNLALGGTGFLGVAEALHGHAADNVVLTQAHTLVIDDAAHGHAADPADISVTFHLAIDDASHAHSANAPSLAQDHALDIDEAAHGHTAEELQLAITHHLSIDDAAHGHLSDPADPVQNIDLAIDDSQHGHTADEVGITSVHALAIDDAAHAHAADPVDLIQAFTLEIEDASHAHVADGVTLQERSVLAIQNSFHLVSSEQVPLVGAIQLTVDDAVHSHAADALAIEQTHVLTIDGASHSHHADGLTITTVAFLDVSSASHAHLADGVALDQVHSLSIDEALHGHQADSPTLAENVDLLIDSAAHVHTADGADLDQHHALAVDDAAHSHAADPCDLTPTPILAIDDALHGHSAEEISLAQYHQLAVDDAAHGVSSDEITLSVNVDLVVDDAAHGHSAENVDLLQTHALAIDDSSHATSAEEVGIQHNHILVIEDSAHAHEADGLTLVQNFDLVIDDATHAVTSDEVTILVRYALEIDDATHAHSADPADLSQDHLLLVADAEHAVSSDEPVLDTPWYQTQRARAVLDRDCIPAVRHREAIDIRIYPSGEDCS